MGERTRCKTDRISVLLKWYIRLTCMQLPLLSGRDLLTCACKLQKGVMISHLNVIANILQITTFEKRHRDSRRQPGSKYPVTEVALGLLPQSHIYSLVIICHATTYRGDQVINLPKFEIKSFLTSIQRFKINSLYVVSWSFSRTPVQTPPDYAHRRLRRNPSSSR